MLSQIKSNLRQAISCILMHQEELLALCSSSLSPLTPYLHRILPANLLPSFLTIALQTPFNSIHQFFAHLHHLQRDATQFSTPNNKSSPFAQQNSSSHFKRSGFLGRRKTTARGMVSLVEGDEKSSVAGGVYPSQKQFAEIVFKEHMKLNGGAKRLASFTEKQLFKETLNYHKIIKFLEGLQVKLLPDCRLKLLIMIKKNSEDSNFVKKGEFERIYKEMRGMFGITEGMEREFFEGYEREVQAKRGLFSRKLDLRSQRRMSRMTRLPSVHQSEKSTVKINPEKVELNKSFNQKQRSKQESSNHLFLNFSEHNPLEKLSPPPKSSLPNRLYKSKANSITWNNLSKATIESTIANKQIKVPDIGLRRGTKEDEYYLAEFYKSNGLQNQIIRTCQTEESQPSPNKSMADSHHY